MAMAQSFLKRPKIPRFREDTLWIALVWNLEWHTLPETSIAREGPSQNKKNRIPTPTIDFQVRTFQGGGIYFVLSFCFLGGGKLPMRFPCFTRPQKTATPFAWKKRPRQAEFEPIQLETNLESCLDSTAWSWNSRHFPRDFATLIQKSKIQNLMVLSSQIKEKETSWNSDCFADRTGVWTFSNFLCLQLRSRR